MKLFDGLFNKKGKSNNKDESLAKINFIEEKSFDVNSYIDEIPNIYEPLKEHAKKYLTYRYNVNDDSIEIGHRPWVAPLCYAITIFKPVNKSWFQNYENKYNKSIPDLYKEFLSAMNGCFYYGFSLYGFDPSIQEDNPYIRRNTLQCMDVGTANDSRINSYNNVDGKFYFGSRKVSFTENIGYFLTENNAIEAIKKSGEVVNQWSDFNSFLKDELEIAEKMMREEDTEDRWNQ